jgi:hypothetical protein
MGTPFMKATASSAGILAGAVAAGGSADEAVGIAGGGASQTDSTGVETGLGSVLAQPTNNRVKQIAVLFITGVLGG